MVSALAIAGTGGFARQILPIIEEQPQTVHRFYDERSDAGDFSGYPAFPLAEYDGGAPFVVAIGDRAVRHAMAQRMRDAGGDAGTLIAATARVARLASIGHGAIICDFAVIEPYAEIGEHVHANVRSFIAHECSIGDFVTLAPGAICNGNVRIEDFAYIGAGAVIRQGTPTKPLTIGRGAIIGMGAVVTRDVPPGATVVGNPARTRTTGATGQSFPPSS